LLVIFKQRLLQLHLLCKVIKAEITPVFNALIVILVDRKETAMKTIALFTISCLLMLGKPSFGQVSKAELPDLLASKKFTFHATRAIPLADATLNQVLNQLGAFGNNVMQLDGMMYDVQVSPDSLLAHLPYFGRTFTPIYGRNISGINDLNENGISFNSKKFTYKSEARKKGAWRIQLNTQDIRENYRMLLEISENGYATLYVRDLYRQGISFYGYIDSIPEK
jgi:hypothetical protein